MTTPAEIAIIGIDGAGKTSLARSLVDRLRPTRTAVVKSRRRVLGHQVHEALQIRKSDENDGTVPLLDSAAFVTSVYLDMAEDQLQVASDLADLDLIIWDRHLRCFSAHGLTQGLPVAWCRRMEHLCPAPTLSLWLDVDIDVAWRRLGDRDGDGRTYETKDYLTRARAAYATLNGNDPRVIRLDGSGHTDVVLEAAVTAVTAALRARSPVRE